MESIAWRQAASLVSFTGGKFCFVRQGHGRAADAAAHGIIPGGDVQQKFPDAVSILDRPGGGGPGVHAGQQFENANRRARHCLRKRGEFDRRGEKFQS